MMTTGSSYFIGSLEIVNRAEGEVLKPNVISVTPSDRTPDFVYYRWIDVQGNDNILCLRVEGKVVSAKLEVIAK